MAARALLVAVAVVVAAWLALMLRNDAQTAAAGEVVFRAPLPGPAELDRALARLRDAELLNPDPRPRTDRARYLLARGRPRAALTLAGAVVEEEPANIGAWTVVLEAGRHVDPRRAREARAQILRLDPLAGRGRR